MPSFGKLCIIYGTFTLGHDTCHHSLSVFYSQRRVLHYHDIICMAECLKCVVCMSCGISKCEIKFNQMPGNTCTIRYANRFSSGRLIAAGNTHMRE